MIIDHNYVLSVPIRADDGETVELVPVVISVRLRSKSEVAARIISGNVERAFRNSIYAEAEGSK